ncbi:MAG: nucleotidyltransferase domain-containing protein [Melioribacteraceae bacterium]|nr:nucleotidyltransferase domain-containing protein [Melioribacteraceae bacterium]
MTEHKSKQHNTLVHDLEERAKELKCLYKIENVLNDQNANLEDTLQSVVDFVPTGWQYPDLCEAQLVLRNLVFTTNGWCESKYSITRSITIRGRKVGEIQVIYRQNPHKHSLEVFLPEEENLLKTIAERVAHFVLHNDLRHIFKEVQSVKKIEKHEAPGEWKVVLDMIRKTDPTLFMSILRKMLHQLCWKGNEEAAALLSQSSIEIRIDEEKSSGNENKPLKKKIINNYEEYINAILGLSYENFTNEELLQKIQKWIQEDNSIPLIRILEARESTLAEISDAIRKYYHIAPEKFELSPSMAIGLRVSLLRRFFTEDLNYIKTAKEFVKLTDFYNLIDKMIYTPTSQGKLGGKSSGVFVASNVLNKKSDDSEILKNIKIPKTWFLASDCVLAFMRYNNLEEVLEQKYKQTHELKMEYPLIVQLFKNSEFPPEIEKGLSVALDDLGNVPLVVRSSSLLEDQAGASFSGKYKSLFLANQGTKKERLLALEDAIAEVYASTFGPDPIEYRAERGLLDFHEEMGVMIQQVVGNKIGKYYFPTYAGVMFSNNEFRWSPRIKREDGLIRLVPGLGTRAVDRIGDDYPILIAPGQPNLRVNVSYEDTIRYSPKFMDVINLESNQFETITVESLVKEYGEQCPGIYEMISIIDNERLRPANIMDDLSKSEVIVTFNGLLSNTRFIQKSSKIINTLKNSLQTPVDIEFASDGKDFYILQCRPQISITEHTADLIPRNIPKDRIIFTANKHISNGKVPDITHIVYVDAKKYSELPDRESMTNVGRAIGRLNKLLPKRKFILMGPGRWGSRGDIKLGVSVTYADISNSAMLIEIARKKGSYIPDLSFGTHFFQDLIESRIRYLPLYPDDEGIIFNQKFLQLSKNSLIDLIPEYKKLVHVLRVIDIPAVTEGKHLQVLINAEIDEAMAIIKDHGGQLDQKKSFVRSGSGYSPDEWKWRCSMAQKIAELLDCEKYGVKGMYIFGSTQNANAGPGSDIDLIIHVDEKSWKKVELDEWFLGWSQALSEMNYLRSGYRTDGLLDIHYITDTDIKKKTGYALKLTSAIDKAKPLKIAKGIK